MSKPQSDGRGREPMHLLSESVPATRRSGAPLVLVGLGASVVALAAAPALMPADYSWVSNTTSESAAQGVQGAWMARLGFVLFGLSVILLAAQSRRRWGPWATVLLAAFGVLMTAAAAFSNRPWTTGEGFDRTEDLLHSVAATGMGIAFAIGVIASAVWRARRRVLDVIAVVASVTVPLGMSMWPEIDGAIQRLMFAMAYLWYGTEAVRTISERSAVA